MEVYECIRSRRTVRRFKPEPVPDSVVNRVLQAARWVPSSRNQQPWHLIVVTDRRTLTRIADISATGKFLAEAPLAIAVVMDDADQAELDAGRALQQMELMAWSEGLGTCFVTLDNGQARRVKDLMDIPTGMDLITVMPFGYRKDDFEGRGIPRKPLAQIAHDERFGTRRASG